ncbi:MAG: hypothetical protein Q7S09_04535 [bacterium]|nr:hypothetical protein [bacterium]
MRDKFSEKKRSAYVVLFKEASFLLFSLAMFVGAENIAHATSAFPGPAPVFDPASGNMNVLTGYGYGSDDSEAWLYDFRCELNVDGTTDTCQGPWATAGFCGSGGQGGSLPKSFCPANQVVNWWGYTFSTTDGGGVPNRCGSTSNPSQVCVYQDYQQLDPKTNLRKGGSAGYNAPNDGNCEEAGYSSEGNLKAVSRIDGNGARPWQIVNGLMLSISSDASAQAIMLGCVSVPPVPAPTLRIEAAAPQGACQANNTVTVRLNWDDRKASQYTVIWYNASDIEIGRTPDLLIPGSVLAYDISGLSKGTLYKFEVKARYDGAGKDSRGAMISNRISVTTNSCLAPGTHFECVSGACIAVPNTAGICANQNACTASGASCPGAILLALDKASYGAGEVPIYTITGGAPNSDILWSSWKDGVPTGEQNTFYGHVTDASGNWTGAGYAWVPRLAGSWVKKVSINSFTADAVFSVFSSVGDKKCGSLSGLNVICLNRGDSYILDGTIVYGAGPAEPPKMSIGAAGLGYIPMSYPFGCNAKGEQNSIGVRNIADDKICEVLFANTNTETISGIGVYTITANADAPEGDYPFGLVSSSGSTVAEPDFYVRIQ